MFYILCFIPVCDMLFVGAIVAIYLIRWCEAGRPQVGCILKILRAYLGLLYIYYVF